MAPFLGLLALAASVAFGQPLQGAAFRDFSGGYVDAVESSNLEPGQSPNALNGVIDDPQGSFKPRNGIALCGNVPGGGVPSGLYEYSKSDGTKRLIVTDNSKVWETRDCRTFTGIKTSGLSSTLNLSFATIRDKVWAVNGSTHPFTWDGSTTTILDGRASTPSPAPAKCAYLQFWKERVWCAKTSNDPSAVYFSALTDTNGNDLDPSTGTLAWPAINVFQVDQNGGSAIYGIKAYRDRLYVFKDNGIWEIQFNSEFDNAVRKTASSYGSRFNTAIAEIDGLLYFVGKDGIYAFDGDQSVRLSGPIENKFRALNQPQISTQYKIWTTQSDFEGGTLSSATAARTSGSVEISSKSANLTNGTFENGTNISPWACAYNIGSVANTHPYARNCIAISSDAATGYPPITGAWSFGATGKCASGGSGGVSQGYYLFDVNGSTLTNAAIDFPGLTYAVQTIDLTNYMGQVVRLKLYSEPGGTADDLYVYSGTFTVVAKSLTFGAISVECLNSGGTHGWAALDDFTNAVYYTSATWTSAVFNAVTVSSWTTFEANSSANGGSVSYEYRTGTSEANTTAIPFATITPGAGISTAAANIYIQVRASLFADAGLTSSPRLDDVTISYTQGGTAANAIHLAGWRNRPWISASSGTATTNNVVLVKSRLPLNSWMPYDLQIGPMVQFNDNFYAGASTHSAIYRLDYGTSDDGRAINWLWETRDEMWGLPNNKKYLLEMGADFKKGTATNAKLGFSKDYGTTYTDRTINMNGSGRGSTKQNINGGMAFSYRFRIFDSTKDETATITGIYGGARASAIRE